MKNKEDIKNSTLFLLNNTIERIKQNKYDITEDAKERQIERYNFLISNIEEVTSIIGANEAARILYLYASDCMCIAYDTVGIEIGGEIDNFLKNINAPKEMLLSIKNTELWDQTVQKIYNLLGYDNILPTHKEIKGVEQNLERLQTSGVDNNSIIQTIEQINLKKCALGELEYQFYGGIPIKISADVKAETQRAMNINS